MASYDRTQIIDLIKSIWPETAGMLSSEVQAFLNDKTGCAVTHEISNGTAFDIWRQAIAKQTEHKHVWPYSQEQIDQMQIKARQMKADEEERQRKLRDGDGVPRS